MEVKLWTFYKSRNRTKNRGQEHTYSQSINQATAKKKSPEVDGGFKDRKCKCS